MTDFKIPEKWVYGDLHKYIFKGEFADWLVFNKRCERTKLKRIDGDIWIAFNDTDALEFISKFMEEENVI